MKKLSVYFSSAMFYLLISLGVNISLSSEAQAQNCTGTEYACNTYNGSSWSTVPGSKASTSFSATTFTFNNSSSYPMTSDQTIEKTSQPPIYVTIISGPSRARTALYFLRPSANLRWNAARNGYNVVGYSEDIILRFEARIHNNPFQAVTGTGYTTLPLGADTANWVFNGGRRPQSQNINFSIKATAVLYGALPESVNIPTTTIFEMFGPGGRDGTTAGSKMGEVKIDGQPAIQIEIPKPKTCDAIPAGTERVFNLSAIRVDSLAAGQESSESVTQNVTLNNCPEGVTVRMAVSDAAFPNNNADYLLNTQGTDYAANAGIRLYYNGTEKVTMKTWQKDVTTIAGTMNLPFTAKYYHTGGNLGIGKVQATGTLTITYP